MTKISDAQIDEIAALRQLLLEVAPLVWAFEAEASPLDPKKRQKWERWEREATALGITRDAFAQTFGKPEP